MSAAYRDTLGGLRARYEARRDDVETIEQRIDLAFWNAAPAGLVAELERLRAGAVAASETADEYRRAEESAQALLERLRRLVDALPELERAASALPSNHVALAPIEPQGSVYGAAAGADAGLLASLTGRPWRPGDGLNAGARERIEVVTRLVQAIDLGARHVDRGYFSRSIECDYLGAPITVLAEVAYREQVEQLHIDARHVLATTLPASAPRVSLAPQQARHDFLKLLPFGLVRDVELGDDAFDGIFLVRGDAAAARRVLPRAVRSALTTIAQFDVPHLEIAPGEARIAFACEPRQLVLERAMDALAALRQVSFDVRYRAPATSSAKGQLT